TSIPASRFSRGTTAGRWSCGRDRPCSRRSTPSWRGTTGSIARPSACRSFRAAGLLGKRIERYYSVMFELDAFGVLLLAIWVFAIFDVIKTDRELCRNLPKELWLLLVIILPDVGAIA